MVVVFPVVVADTVVPGAMNVAPAVAATDDDKVVDEDPPD